MKVVELVNAAYVAGYREALQTWAFWKDGGQYVGNSTQTPLSEVMRSAPSDVAVPFTRWLGTQEGAWGPAESLPRTTAGATDGSP